MHVIKVLGAGCGKCATTAERIEAIAGELGADVEVVKEQDLGRIMGYGVLSTPGVVIDGKVVHSGGVPTRLAIKGWLAALAAE